MSTVGGKQDPSRSLVGVTKGVFGTLASRQEMSHCTAIKESFAKPCKAAIHLADTNAWQAHRQAHIGRLCKAAV
jgi:hypothetical protein